jgi:hypothetical protein
MLTLGDHPKPAIEVTTDFGAGSELGLACGRNAMAIWQDLVDGHGFTPGYQSVSSHPIGPSKTGASYLAMLLPSARCSIVCITGRCSNAARGAGPP